MTGPDRSRDFISGPKQVDKYGIPKPWKLGEDGRGFSCYCSHTVMDHKLSRCGCPNDRPAGHPVWNGPVADKEAWHVHFCMKCNKSCFTESEGCRRFQDPDYVPPVDQ